MSFLYGINNKHKFLSNNNNQHDKPSPTCKKGFCQTPISYNIASFKDHIGRISGFSPLHKIRGSMTVEASLVLPLFLFFFLQISGFIEMLRLHSNLEYGLWKAGRTLTLYGIAQEVAQMVPDPAVSYLYVNSVLLSTFGQEYFENAPLALGMPGLNYLRSDIMTHTDEVDLVLTYQICPKGGLLPFSYARLSNRFCGRAWTGYDVTACGQVEREVYVTRYGEVWHTSADCSYLQLTVQKISSSALSSKRNQWGREYEKCSFCTTGATPEQLYITREGDCYHYKKECLGLTRHVEKIPWDERERYRGCGRCAGG